MCEEWRLGARGVRCLFGPAGWRGGGVGGCPGFRPEPSWGPGPVSTAQAATAEPAAGLALPTPHLAPAWARRPQRTCWTGHAAAWLWRVSPQGPGVTRCSTGTAHKPFLTSTVQTGLIVPSPCADSCDSSPNLCRRIFAETERLKK